MGTRGRRRFAERAHSEQKRIAIVGIVVTALLTVAAIVVPIILSSSGSALGLENVLRAALGRVEDAGTSRIVMHIQDLVRPEAIGPEATGFVDYRRRLGRLTFTDSSGATTVVMLWDGDATYARIPGFRRGRWQKLDAAADGLEGTLSTLFIAADPSQELGYLKTLVKVKKLEEENVFGVTTTHYAAIRIVRRATQQQVDVWIDANGLVRRVQVTIPSSSIRLVLDLYAFGVAIRLHPPDDAQVLKPLKP